MKLDYPKFKNQKQEFSFLTNELGFSNLTAYRIIQTKKAVVKRLKEV